MTKTKYCEACKDKMAKRAYLDDDGWWLYWGCDDHCKPIDIPWTYGEYMTIEQMEAEGYKVEA